jgi:hypothetical protein
MAQRRVIVYAWILTGLNEILISGDLIQDSEGNRGYPYQKMAEELQTYAYPPLLLSEHVAEWMNQAELIAVGGFRQVLEDRPDKWSSESDSENSDHGDVFPLGICTPPT